jgi:hypothetical protein
MERGTSGYSTSVRYEVSEFPDTWYDKLPWNIRFRLLSGPVTIGYLPKSAS